MPILKSWIATHTGLPSFYLSGPGVLMAGDRTIVTLKANDERLVSDAGAGAGEETTYTYGSQTVTLVRDGFDHMLLTDATGRGLAKVRMTGDDSRSHEPGVSVFDNQSGSPIVRYSAVAPTPSGTIECLSLLADTLTIRGLCKRRSPMWLVHNDSICRLPGCDIEGARYVQPTKLSESRTLRRDRAERAWQIDYRELDPSTAPPAPVVTWGEWEAWGDESGNPAGWQNWSAIQVAQKVAGMPA